MQTSLTTCQSQLADERKQSRLLSADVKAKQVSHSHIAIRNVLRLNVLCICKYVPCMPTQAEIDKLKAQVKTKADEVMAEKNEMAKLQRKKAKVDATVASQKVRAQYVWLCCCHVQCMCVLC